MGSLLQSWWMIQGYWIWRRGRSLEIRSPSTCLLAYLLVLKAYPVGSQEIPVELRLRQGDVWGGRLQENVWVICWKWGREWEKAAVGGLLELGVSLGIGIGKENGEMKICCWPTCFPGWHSWWVPRECLMDLGAGTKGLYIFYILIKPRSINHFLAKGFTIEKKD